MNRAEEPDKGAVSPPDARHARHEPAEKRDASGPLSGARAEAAHVVACPYCQSQDVELLAVFGAQLLTDQYYCNTCHTPFEHVRDA